MRDFESRENNRTTEEALAGQKETMDRAIVEDVQVSNAQLQAPEIGDSNMTKLTPSEWCVLRR